MRIFHVYSVYAEKIMKKKKKDTRNKYKTNGFLIHIDPIVLYLIHPLKIN
jgi:hypothetical protein